MKKKTVMAFVLALTLAFTPMSGELWSVTAEASVNDAVSDGSDVGDNSTNEGENESNEVQSPSDETVDDAEGTESSNDIKETENNGVDNETGGNESKTSAGGDAAENDDANGVSVALSETEGKTQLAAPTGLEWGENWSLTWDAVSESEGYYEIEIYKDGDFYYRSGWSGLNGEEKPSIEGSLHINESGTYKFHVKARCSFDPENYVDSEWSEFSEEKKYTRPLQTLGTTTGYWDSEKAGVFNYTGVEGAGGYLLELFYIPSGFDTESSAGMTYWVIANYKYTTDLQVEDTYFINQMDYYGAGRYRVRITALSGNIDEIANGPTGEFSAYFDTTEISKGVSGTISDAMEASTASEALATIKNEVKQSELRTAMQTDSTVLNQMKELEDRYVAEKGITKSDPVVSEAASAYVKAQDISVVGAGLNVESGEVRLEVSVPEKKEDVSGYHYADSVQLDISLLHDNTKVHELEVPITITLPIPNGLDASRLVILHYHEDGTFETVSPKINGNGTVTFTVVRFSTFVFAVEQENSNTNNTENNTTAGDNSGDSNTPQGSIERVKDDVPKTGNSMPISVPITGTASAGALAVMAVLLRKKQKNG